MSPLVVLFALFAAACGSLVPAQPPYHGAVVLDPHGRPLDTAEVINARALHLQAKHLEGHYAPLVHAAPLAVAHAAPLAVAHATPLAIAPAAVSHQSRVDVHSSPAVVAHSYAAPVLAHSALAHGYGHGYGHGFGHWLRKRSLGYASYAAPIVAHVAPSAVSHQSRVDVISSPAVVSHAVHAPVVAHAVHAPVVAHVAPAAVSHQSRVDYHASHPVVSHAVVAAPVVSTHSAWAAPGYGVHGYDHLLKRRSLAFAHAVPVSTVYVGGSAVTHQSRVDVTASHVAPIAVAHSAPVVVAHAAPAVAHVTPLAHSAVWTAPAAHWAHSPLSLAAHW